MCGVFSMACVCLNANAITSKKHASEQKDEFLSVVYVCIISLIIFSGKVSP